MSNDSPLPPSGRGMLSLVVGLLVLPFIVGTALHVGDWQPSRTVQHGQLLSPPRPLPGGLLQSSRELHGKWLLLLAVRGPCTADCSGRVDAMQRIHLALNKHSSRLRRVVLTDQPDDPQLVTLRGQQPGLLIVAAPPGTLNGKDEALLVADPQGQLIMAYPPDAAAQGVRADLERLLKFAWTG